MAKPVLERLCFSYLNARTRLSARTMHLQWENKGGREGGWPEGPLVLQLPKLQTETSSSRTQHGGHHYNSAKTWKVQSLHEILRSSSLYPLRSGVN